MSIDKVVKQAVDNAYAMGKRDGRKEADKIIALLRDEVRAWRKGGVARQPDDEICEAITATNAILAKHNNPL